MTTWAANTAAKSAISVIDGTEIVRISQGGVSKKATSLQLGMFASTFALAGTLALWTAQAATDIPLAVKGATGQSANLFEARSDTDVVAASIGLTRVKLALTPAYDLATSSLAVGLLIPLDSGSQTVSANKNLHVVALSQSSGADITFTVGNGAQATGFWSSMTSASGSHSGSNMYAGVFHVTNAGPGTTKGVHLAAFGSGTSTGTIMACNLQIQPVATQAFACGAFASLTTSGLGALAIGFCAESDGDQYICAFGNGVNPVPVSSAYFRAWMNSSSATDARAFLTLNHAGDPISYLDKVGGAYFTSAVTINKNTGTLQTAVSDTAFHVGGTGNTNIRALVDAYGTGVPRFTLRRAAGTSASPSNLASGNNFGALEWYGYGASAYSSTARATIRALASEDWSDSAQGCILSFQVTAAGGTTVNEVFRVEGTKNLGINGASYGGGLGVVFLANAATNPSTDPTGGGLLYAQAGALKWRGSGGTVTTIANA